MQIVVPFVTDKPWPFKRNTILFLYQISDAPREIKCIYVHFPTTSTSHRLDIVPFHVRLEEAIADFVRCQILAFIPDSKNHDDLASYFSEIPTFSDVFPLVTCTGWVTIEVSPPEVSP